MATVGQFVYNLVDYKHSNIPISTRENIFSSGNNESENLVSFFGGQPKKLGIQAPPGTKFKLNGQIEIVIGRSGIYELEEENILISDLKILRKTVYEKNTSLTDENLSKGIDGLRNAWNILRAGVDALGEDDSTSEYWDAYIKLYDEYKKAYSTAYSQYQTGINGVYEVKKDNGVPVFESIYNIIIDYVYD